MTKPFLPLALFLSILSSTTHAEPKESSRPITIRAVEGLQFDPARVKMDPGQTIRFRILNRDPNDLVHNLVLIKPGALASIQKASLQIDQAAIDRDYLPEHEAVLKHTKLLKADESDDFLFTAPKEPGIYHYICTFPGHANIMYGALYVGERWGSFERDPNIPEVARIRAKEIEAAQKTTPRPTVKRFFLQKSGPAAIAVALENDLNYCWDAGNCRLRYAWSGEFFDLGNNSRSNGNRQLKPQGKEFWNGQGDEVTYTIKTADSSLKPDFKGYRLLKGHPEFKYKFGNLSVTEFLTASSTALLHEIKITNAKVPVKIYAKGNITSNVGTREGHYFVVSAKDASHIQLTIPTQ
ncbi:plastocyanin/azurin family copper-binding protein [bacterium]|nr:plastocyanin/azurin family copper-binding protein [bacterium]